MTTYEAQDRGTPDTADTAATRDGTAVPDGRHDRRRFLGGAAALASAVGLTVAAPAAPAYAQTGGGTEDRRPRGRFQDKVVIITGATSGIGRGTAKAFAAEGAKVGFCGRRVELGREVEREIRQAGGTALYVRADVRVERDVKNFVDQVARHFGGLDIAFNNAGIGRTGTLHEIPVDAYDDVMATNVRGVFLSLRYQIPHLIARGKGVVIVTSSSAAEISRATGSVYSASKRALEGLIRGAALDYGRHGVRVNGIMPGTTDTPFIRPPNIDDATWAQAKVWMGQNNVDALQRLGEVDDIARSVLGLASDDFPYMTGASVFVDGGVTAGRRLLMPPGAPPGS